LLSELSKSFAISSSEGKPPAVTSDANVNVQCASMLLEGAMVTDTCIGYLVILNGKDWIAVVCALLLVGF
jgi:hypothetical protein